ncbi:MAG TPA: glycosyltransferase [Anaerolineales bacterium]|nr:glycosyltransferase [Anaerolineales bacterium]
MFQNKPERLRIFTWHIHGSYLFNLVQCPHEFYVPVKPERTEGYFGRTESYAWPENLHEVAAEGVRDLEFDCVLFQTRKNYFEDQYEVLSAEQRELPRIYLEHDPPWGDPTNSPHHVDDPNILLVHVTHFNNLMWDNGRTPTRVVEHGVIIPDTARYTGELERGLVIVNNLCSRGRRLGLDIFEKVRKEIPLDLVGINSHELGGVASLAHKELLELEGHYRFVFNPIRYTSLGLAICEAMMVGLPIIGLATTEMATAVENGVSGYVDTNVNRLVEHMHRLLANPMEAHRLGRGAQHRAQQRFSIQRFVSDWNNAFASVTRKRADNIEEGLEELLL